MAVKHFVLAVLAGVLAYALPEQAEKRQFQSYDYVIVGGGTAGLVLANRLSANPSLQIAVIEAGANYQMTNPLLSSMPAGDVIGCGSNESPNPLVDWGFITEPMPGTNGRKVRYARGKTLGGSSARNFMIYQRGTRDSYQRWADLVDDQSYTFDSLLPYFKATPSFTPPSSSRAQNASAGYQASAFDNALGGPLQVSYANFASPFSSYIQGSLQEIGLPSAQDFNSGSLMGAQYCASTIRPSNQQRDTSQSSFLEAAKNRSNLAVFSNTLAQSILFNSAKKATGVRVVNPFGVPYTISARKEIIISAGAFQSPQLLMVSGIGPASQLSAFNIPVVKILPGVGQNMIDHVFAGPTYPVKVDTLTKLANDPGYIASQFGDYQKQLGVLTNPVSDFLGWEKIPENMRQNLPQSTRDALATFPKDWPEIEYISAPGFVGDFSNLLATQPKDGLNYATILGTLVAPLSRGNVTLKSKDTKDLPIIQPNWLDHPSDQAVMVAAYKRVRQAFASKFMSDVLAGDKTEYFPGAKVQTDAEILKVIKDTVMTVWHAASTCKMGRSNDVNAVVDTKFKVFGVSGLRIADASVFPLLPPGHPQSTVYVVAEKLAALLLSGN